MSQRAAAQPVKRTRRTQEERSNATRQLLLDATIDCLIDLGYAATTTTVIADRAGVSRGAQLHHYPTKAQLVAAALEHLGNKIGAELAKEASTLSGKPDRVSAAIDALWGRYTSRFFDAWLELWVAARTDADLRREIRPLEGRLRRAAIRRLHELFGDESHSGDLEKVLVLTTYVLQGMAVDRTLRTGPKKDREADDQLVLELWKRVVAMLLAQGNGRAPAAAGRTRKG